MLLEYTTFRALLHPLSQPGDPEVRKTKSLPDFLRKGWSLRTRRPAACFEKLPYALSHYLFGYFFTTRYFASVSPTFRIPCSTFGGQ